ncbi:AAA family ATPase [Ureibacillus sp. GCM10028918]|uniref:AAA family ATPase n=1 Tax=Ureibacillus sp. GCM10028918 TaxID=3273429 RepID=UPI00360ADBC7
MFFVQMSGFPGSGKSTLALEIAGRTGAIIVDHDISKTALLESTREVEIAEKLLGKISYSMDWASIEFYLSQGKSVIFDSPCLYEEMIIKGTSLAKEYKVPYKYVECYLDDFDEVNSRLKYRISRMSQIKEVKSVENFQYTIKNSKKPGNHPYLVVDSSKPIDTYIDGVMDYLLDN